MRVTPASGIRARGLNAKKVITVSNNVLIGDGTKAGEVWKLAYGGNIVATGNVTGTPGGAPVDASNLGTKGAQVQ